MALKFCSILTNSIYNLRHIPQRGIKRHVRKTLRELKERQNEFYSKMSEQEYHEFHRRSNFLDWNYSAEVFAFGKRLHEDFHPEILVQAFTHSSYISKEKKRQEELGVENPSMDLKVNDDFILEGDKIITDYSGRYISHFYPRFPLEGIQSIVNHLASDEVLAHVSKNLGTTFLILSEDYPVQTETYSKTLKAIIGALKNCQGVQRSEFFVRDFIITQLVGIDINDFLPIPNMFEALSNILKNDKRSAPEPRIISQTGMNTILANYHVGIYVDKQLIGHCSGESIDTAIEMAALDALKRLFHTTDSCRPITYDVKDVPKKISNISINEWNSAAFAKK